MLSPAKANDLKGFIEKNKVNEVLQELTKVISSEDKDSYNTLVLLKSRFKQFNDNNMQGITHYSDAPALQKIVIDILTFIDANTYSQADFTITKLTNITFVSPISPIHLINCNRTKEKQDCLKFYKKNKNEKLLFYFFIGDASQHPHSLMECLGHDLHYYFNQGENIELDIQTDSNNRIQIDNLKIHFDEEEQLKDFQKKIISRIECCFTNRTYHSIEDILNTIETSITYTFFFSFNSKDWNEEFFLFLIKLSQLYESYPNSNVKIICLFAISSDSSCRNKNKLVAKVTTLGSNSQCINDISPITKADIIEWFRLLIKDFNHAEIEELIVEKIRIWEEKGKVKNNLIDMDIVELWQKEIYQFVNQNK